MDRCPIHSAKERGVARTVTMCLPGFLAAWLRQVRRHYLLVRAFAYDYGRFAAHSSAIARGDTREKLQALITMDYHGVEKGLSLPQPRPGFGAAVVTRLLSNLSTYLSLYGGDSTTECALQALTAYQDFNSQHGSDDAALEAALAGFADRTGRASVELAQGGTIELTREHVLGAVKLGFRSLMEARHSVRQFSSEPVRLDDIREAISIAQSTPSVCNRQSCRAWVLLRPTEIEDVLEIQGGARGFADQISALLVVTSDLSCFQSSGERYQCWIDGGMFAMSLIAALHSLGLGTCCLNWSKDPDADTRLRAALPLSSPETVILVIAVGNLRDAFRVAKSARRPLADIMTMRA